MSVFSRLGLCSPVTATGVDLDAPRGAVTFAAPLSALCFSGFLRVTGRTAGGLPKVPRARPLYSVLRSAVYRLGDLGVLLPALTSVSPSAQQGGSRAGLAAAIPRCL